MTDPLYRLATEFCLKKNLRLIKFIEEEGFMEGMNEEEKEEFREKVFNCPLFRRE